MRTRDPFTLADLGSWQSESYWPPGTRFVASSDGEYVAIWQGGTLGVHRVADGDTVVTTTTSHFTAAAFHPLRHDGDLVLATAHPEDIVRLWNARTGQVLDDLDIHGEVTQLTFSPDGHRMALAYVDGQTDIWDAVTWGFSATLTNPPATTLTATIPLSDVIGLGFSHDGARLAAAFGQGVVRVWDVESDVIQQEWGLPVGTPRALAWSRDDRLLAISTSELVYLWNPTTGREVKRWPCDCGRPEGQLAFCSRRGTQVLAVSQMDYVLLWDVP